MHCFDGKIFRGNIDELVHISFQKFGRGVFKDRAIIKASSSASGFSISATAEYANDFVRILAEKLGQNKTKINGIIISTSNLKDKLPCENVKQFAGVKQYIISKEMSGNEIINLMKKFPEVFFALSFGFGDTVLKIKPKSPKSLKPGVNEIMPKADFCKINTKDKKIIEEILFDAPEYWKKIDVNHTFVINEIEIPKNISDPNQMRKLAKRKGKLIRKITIDGKESIKEKDFVA